jgi:RNA polymerase sigma factor for flagellar operon FliA
MLERKPTNSDIAEHLNITIDEYEKQRTHADRFKIENIQTDSDEDGDPFDGHVGASENPLTLVEDEQLSELLTNKISQLNDRKKLVMNLYYVEELNLKEIGDVIGVKESRVSQILSSIAQELRDEIAKDTK